MIRNCDHQKPYESLCLRAFVAKRFLPQRHKDAKIHKETVQKTAQVPSNKNNRISINRIFILVYLNLFLSISSYAQSDSLYKYLEIAAKHNPTVLQKFSEYQAALKKIPQVGSLSDPELSVGVFLSPMEIVNGNQVADIRIMQMFPWFGVLKNAKDEMSLMAKAKFELFRDAKLQVFYDVQRNWYELYKIQKDISISEKNIDILKIIERLALVRFKSPQVAGSGYNMGSSSSNAGLTDLYRIQIETGDLENNIALLKNQKNTVMALFNTYLNRPVTTPVFINENISADSLFLSLADVSDSILVNNPMLGMLNFEKQSQEARKKMVTRMGYPMVGLGLNYSLISKTQFPMGLPSMNGKDMIMPMVVVTLPIYRKKYNAMKDESELLETATAQNYEATSNSLQVEYYQAVQFYMDSKRRIKLYANQYQLASKSFDIMLKSFSVSTSGLTDVLRASQQTLNYELKQVEAVADLNIATAWLKRLGNLEVYGNK
jgi:outer membrane protein TolC